MTNRFHCTKGCHAEEEELRPKDGRRGGRPFRLAGRDATQAEGLRRASQSWWGRSTDCPCLRIWGGSGFGSPIPEDPEVRLPAGKCARGVCGNLASLSRVGLRRRGSVQGVGTDR